MNETHDASVRAALLRLGSDRTVRADDVALPMLFRTPAIALLWIASIATLVGLLALGRVRVPQHVRGIAVTTNVGNDSAPPLLLLPATAAARVAAGQRAVIELEGRPIALTVVSVDTALLDMSSAKRRFRNSPRVLTHFDAPKVVAVLAPCSTDKRCLTHTSEMYPATAALGSRSLASYAWPDKSPFAR